MKKLYDIDRTKVYWFLEMWWSGNCVQAKHKYGWVVSNVDVRDIRMVMFFDYHNEFPFYP